MGLLIAYILGAASAAVLILVVLRKRSGEDAAVHQSLGGLRELMSGLQQQQQQLNEQATRWNQLLGRSSDRGSWGEVSLQNLIESADLRQHIDFDVQVHTVGEDGAGRPDLVLRLPDGGRLPVDSKAIWNSYDAALAEEDPAVRQDHLKRHARQVRKCIQSLGAKSYWNLFPDAPRMVVLFMPSEAAFAAAASADPELVTYAMKRRVAIATPTTLFALLQIVAVGWHRAELTQNSEEIRRLGEQLVRRLNDVSASFTRASRGLDQTVRAHNEVSTAFDGKLLSTARKMGDLGIAGGKDLESPAMSEVPIRPLVDRESDEPEALPPR